MTENVNEINQVTSDKPKAWQRGDAGPAPVDFIFSGTPPTTEECPDGYLTSACGGYFQSATAAFLGCVGIVLSPTKMFEVNVIKETEDEHFGKKLQQYMWKAGVILSPEIKLNTEEEIVSFFKDLAASAKVPDEGEYHILPVGLGFWNHRLNALCIPVKSNKNWMEVHENFYQWAKLSFDDCVQNHLNFIKDNLNLTVADKIETQEDLSKIYLLLDGFNHSMKDKFTTVCKKDNNWFVE